jgi:hypothetical protein
MAGYIQLKTIEAMRLHRRRLRNDLMERSKRCFDVGSSIRLFDEDNLAIEEGLHELDDLSGMSGVWPCACLAARMDARAQGSRRASARRI